MRSPSYKQCILATIENCSLICVMMLHNAYSLILDEAVGYNMQYPWVRLLSSCLLGPTSHIKSEPSVLCLHTPHCLHSPLVPPQYARIVGFPCLCSPRNIEIDESNF